MLKQSIIEKLEIYNDVNFLFDPIQHKYTYNGETFISVTQLISRFHKEFDSNYWSDKKAKQLGITQDEILLKWKELNDSANIIGSETHNWIENYYNRVYQELPINLDVIDRINKFNIIYSKQLYKLEPVKFEQRIFSTKWKIAGMIDSLFIYKDNIFINDWKTNKLFTDDDHKKGKFERLLPPFNHEFKNHLNEYSIQVSLYKLILKEIGIDIKACYLIHIGPEEEAKIYKAKDYTEILEEYLLSAFYNNN